MASRNGVTTSRVEELWITREFGMFAFVVTRDVHEAQVLARKQQVVEIRGVQRAARVAL